MSTLANKIIKRNLRFSDLIESDSTWIHKATCKDIQLFEEKHGEVWLGKYNLSSPYDESAILIQWEGAKIYNFQYDFMVPCYDQKLVDLILTRHLTPYTNGTKDMKLLAEIQSHIHSLGGQGLFWI
jgi:hypothetical protein